MMTRFFSRVYRYIFKGKDPKMITDAIESTTGVCLKQIRSADRHKNVVEARKRLIRNLNLYTDLSVPQIAEYVKVSKQYTYKVLGELNEQS